MFNIETRANVLLDAMRDYCISQILVYDVYINC